MSHFINLANIQERQSAHLQALAEELQTPIVMVSGRGRQSPFDPTSREDWEARVHPTTVLPDGVTYDDLIDRAIMVFNWAGKHANRMDILRVPLPGMLWSDDEPRFSDLREYCCDWRRGAAARQAGTGEHDPSRYTTTEPVYLEPQGEDRRLIGEIAERVFWSHYSMEYILEQRRFQPAVWYDAPIRRAVDENFAAELAERRETVAREGFTTFMGEGRMSQRVVNLRQAIHDNEMNLTTYRDRQAQAMRELIDQQRELDALTQIIANGDVSWDEYWERLKAHPRLTAIEWERPWLIFRTDEVQLRHPTANTSTPLGVMEIKVNIELHNIEIRNITNPRGNRAHPHVNGFAPCFGEYGSAVVQLLSDGDLAGLIELMFVYLETFNPRDDWGRYGAYWFRSDGTPVALHEATDERVERIRNGTDPDATTDGDDDAIGLEADDELIEDEAIEV